MRIGEVAAAGGTTAKALRFYEETGLLAPPERTAGGYRDYSPQVLARLDFIRRARAAGLTLAQAREILEIRDAGGTPCTHVQDLLGVRLDELDAQIADLTALRDTVAGLHAAANARDPAECQPTGICGYL